MLKNRRCLNGPANNLVFCIVFLLIYSLAAHDDDQAIIDWSQRHAVLPVVLQSGRKLFHLELLNVMLVVGTN